MSRNEDRGLTASGNDTVADSSNPFEFPTQTEFVDLPSKGLYYPEDNALYHKESVEVRFMTAADEDIITNKSYIDKGLALEKLVKHVLVDPQIDVKSMQVQDQIAIVLALRITAYGKFLTPEVQCSACKHKHKVELNLEDIKFGGFNLDPREAVDITDAGIFITLPRCGWKFEVRPITTADPKKLIFNKKIIDNISTKQLEILTKSVTVPSGDVYSDNKNITKAIKNMPASDATLLRDKYTEIFPSVDASFSITCPECDHESKEDLPLDVGLFWIKR